MNPGDSISRYRIVRPLGQGGMGVVYLAEDSRLDRPVALKFLPRDSFDPQDRDRFLNEARAAARIRHPNVCPIYDVEEADGQIFIAMAYLDGETLAKAISRGRMPIHTVIAIGLQIARGLDEAHRLGIVHRDVKCGNVIVAPSGDVSILDFGLALLPGVTRLTAPGQASGTPAYMAPEQARGELVDARADIWSLGAVLYEMVAGVLPFGRPHAVAVLHAILHDREPRLLALRPDVPPQLAALIHKALEKSPGKRWQTAADLACELQRIQESYLGASATMTMAIPSTRPRSSRWRLPAAAAVLAIAGLGGGIYLTRRSASLVVAPSRNPSANTDSKQVAVLPFRVSGAPGSAGVIADGLTDVVTEALSDSERTGGAVAVIPASEIRRRAIVTAADALRVYGATLALSGSGEPNGARIRFNLQLLDTASSRLIRSATFDYDPAAPLEAKNRAVAEAAALLHLPAAPKSEARAALNESRSPDAYSAYLEGKGLLARYDVKPNIEKAISALRRAVAADPNFALAWSGLGEAYLRKMKNDSEKSTADLALESARRAVSLDPGLAIVHAVLGMVYGAGGQNKEAIVELQTALKIAPGSAEAAREIARIYTNLGRFAEAESSYQQAIQVRPTDWYAHLLLGLFYMNREHYGEAEAAFRRAASLAPNNELIARNLAVVFTAQGKYEEAIKVLLASLKVRQNDRTYLTLAATYFYQHRFQEAAAAIETAIDLDSSRYPYWGNLGIYCKWIPGSEGRVAPALRRAIELARKRLQVTPGEPEIRADLAEYYARLGDSAAAMAEISNIPKSAQRSLANRLAIAYELTGNRAKAIELIASGITISTSLSTIKDDPDLKGLWDDPAFQRALPGSLRR